MNIITTDGRVLFLDVLFGRQPAPDLEVGLFTNVLVPSITTKFSDLSEPLGDYTRVTVPNWTRQQSTEPPIMAGDQVNFTITGWTGTIYGYYISVGDRVISVENFDIPYNITTDTQSLGISPRFLFFDA